MANLPSAQLLTNQELLPTIQPFERVASKRPGRKNLRARFRFGPGDYEYLVIAALVHPESGDDRIEPLNPCTVIPGDTVDVWAQEE